MAKEEYRNLSNVEYWEKRSLEVVEAKWKKEGVLEKELAKQYTTHKEAVQKEIADFYLRYSSERGIGYTDAIALLNQSELASYRQQMDKLASLAPTDSVREQIQLLKDAKKLDRLQALVNRLDAELLQLGYDQQITLEQSLAEQYKATYYETAYTLSSGLGVAITFDLLPTLAIQQAITTPLRGVMFSNAVWDNRNLLVKQLRITLTDGLIRGESNQKMAKRIAESMDNSYKNALRLVRTETAKVVNQGTIDGYQATDFLEKVRLIATLDRRTSKVCQGKDGELIVLKDAIVGVHLPPFHPNCRTAIAPYIEGKDLAKSKRIARDEDGVPIKVPATMKYAEWYDTYIKDN